MRSAGTDARAGCASVRDMTTARIVCIGNPYRDDDWVGPAVFDALRATDLPPGVELVDGGLLGLDLLRLMEGVESVVFADTLLADGADTCLQATVIDDPAACADARLGFDHAGGLAYLLRAAPLVVEPMPRVWVVGAAAAADVSVIPAVARAALEIADGR